MHKVSIGLINSDWTNKFFIGRINCKIVSNAFGDFVVYTRPKVVYESNENLSQLKI